MSVQASGTSAFNRLSKFRFAKARRIELRQIFRRREHYKNRRALANGFIGVALSGGGMRSATFSLGVLRGLAQARVLNKVDYLSTVSGGSYIGAFFGSLYVPIRARGNGKASTENEAKLRALALGNELFAGKTIGHKAIERLRQFGQYLAPGGGGDIAVAVGIIGRNWLAIQAVIGISLLTLGLLLNSARVAMSDLAAGLDLKMSTYWSPWWLAAVAVGLWPVAAGWAYWLTKRDFLTPRLRYWGLWWVATLLIGLGSVAMSFEARSPLFATLAIAAFGAIILHRRAEQIIEAESATNDPEVFALNAAEDRVRGKLSRWLGAGLVWTTVATILVMIDTAGLWLARIWHWPSVGGNWSVFAPAGIPALLATVRWLIANVQLPTTGSTPTRQVLIDFVQKNIMRLAGLLGVALALATAVIWSAVGHLVSWKWTQVPAVPVTHIVHIVGFDFRWQTLEIHGAEPGDHFIAGWPLGLCIVLSLILAISPSFLNLSSLATFYAARLRRAYLGATNLGNAQPSSAKIVKSHAAAVSGAKSVRAVDSDLPDDDISLSAYYQHSLAPVHLINVTINETRARGSSLIQRDRRGKPLIISPGGIMFTGGNPKEVDVKPFRSVYGPPEEHTLRVGDELPLSVWVGISGAAISTGLGWRSSLGLSLLTGLANLRLGYWWKRYRTSGVWPIEGPRDTTHAYLFQELRASFTGTDGERWNLSDGGHFDNTGIYELIRRKVRFIIACDNGEDEKYGFDDLSGLVRKARIDFGASIDFLEAEELDTAIARELRPLFAGIAEFALPTPPAAAVAAVARIAYRGRAKGILLLLKPRMTGNGPADLVRYTETAKPFPQQSVIDQFFDEAQWESYYELGRRMTAALFKRPEIVTTNPRWSPNQLSGIS